MNQLIVVFVSGGADVVLKINIASEGKRTFITDVRSPLTMTM